MVQSAPVADPGLVQPGNPLDALAPAVLGLHLGKDRIDFPE
jgi:hypothetical protein